MTANNMPIGANRDRICPSQGNCINCKFAFWNAGGLTEDKFTELKHILVKDKIDAFAVVEAGAVSDDDNQGAELQGYTIYNLPRSRRIASGMLIGVRQELISTFKIIHSMQEEDMSEIVKLELWINHTKTKFFIVYNPPNNIPKTLDKLNLDSNTVLVGDFNAPSENWNYERTTEVGRSIEEFVDVSPLILLQDSSSVYTFLAHNGGISRPDLAFVHANLIDSIKQRNMECPSGVGHKILLLTRCNIEQNKLIIRTSWNFKKADWYKFTEETELKFKARKKTRSPDIEQEEINNILQVAAKKYIPRGKVPTYKPYWNKELTALKKNRDKLRREIEHCATQEERNQRTRQLTKIQREFSKCIIESKTRSFHEFVQSIDYKKDGTKAYTFFSKLNNKAKTEGGNNPINYKNRVLIADKDKAEALAEYYAQESGTRRLPKIKVEKRTYVNDERDVYNSKFLIYELEMALKKLKNKKSPGVDLIYPEFLKHLGKEGKVSILHLFNLSWIGNIPDVWRKAEVIPLLKKGKDGTKVESYRPIALTSMMAKLMEHMVKYRLAAYLEVEEKLSKHQAGFRKHRGTMDQIAYFSQDVKEGFNKMQKTLVVYVDFKSAFDLVDRNKLLRKMEEKRVPSNIIRWTKVFMSIRMMRVRFGETRSRYRQTRIGVQQGGVLSPIHFVIYIDDLADYIKDRSEVEVKLFADDVIIWCTHNDTQIMEQEMNKAMKALQEWTVENGMIVNKQKTMYDFHTLGQDQINFNITYGEDKLEKTDEAIYLGMTHDRKMSGVKQIDKIVSSSKKRLNLMKMVAGVTWGANTEVLITTYKTYIRPVLESANALLVSAPKNKLENLEKVQNQALRIAMGAVKSTPIVTLQASTNIPPLEARREIAAACLHEKLIRLDEENWTREPHERLKTQKTFISSAKEVKSKLIQEINIEDRLMLPKYNPKVAVLNVKIELTVPGLRGKGAKNYDDYLRRGTVAYLHTKYPENEWLHVYTDGSAKAGKGMAGAGVYCREFEKSFPVGKNGSSFDGEVQAIHEALKLVRGHHRCKIVILSDSQEALQAIGNREQIEKAIMECKVQLLKLYEEKKEIVLQWVPAHCALYGNEKADFLAKRGGQMSQENRALSYTSVKSHIMTAAGKKVKEEWNRKAVNKIWKSVIGSKKYRRGKNRRESSAQFRLDTGHDLLGPHLHRMGLALNSTCCLCGNGVQDRRHFFACEATARDRDAMPNGMTYLQRESCLYWITRSHMMAK